MRSLDGLVLNRASGFSYQCNACGICCYNKRIQTNPYEIVRLARNRALSTGEFIHSYLEEHGPYLRVDESGACIFLVDGGCLAHNDRPLACRTYPLGRWVSGDGQETFRALLPHPQTRGVYGTGGTVAEFLEQQGALPYMDAADRYQALFYRLFDALQGILPQNPGLPEKIRDALSADGATGFPDFMKWLDVDSVVRAHCKESAGDLPLGIEQTLNLHIEVVEKLVTKS